MSLLQFCSFDIVTFIYILYVPIHHLSRVLTGPASAEICNFFKDLYEGNRKGHFCTTDLISILVSRSQIVKLKIKPAKPCTDYSALVRTNIAQTPHFLAPHDNNRDDWIVNFRNKHKLPSIYYVYNFIIHTSAIPFICLPFAEMIKIKK